MKTELSFRELSVLELAAKGYTDDMISREMGIEKGTVNSYWVRIRGKHGHLSRTELVARFVQARANAAYAAATSETLIASTDVADALAEKNQNVLDLANREIERLKKLLKKH